MSGRGGAISAWAMSAMAKSTRGTMWVRELKRYWSAKLLEEEDELWAGSQVDVTLETCEIVAVMAGRENTTPAAALPIPSKRDIPMRI